MRFRRAVWALARGLEVLRDVELWMSGRLRRWAGRHDGSHLSPASKAQGEKCPDIRTFEEKLMAPRVGERWIEYCERICGVQLQVQKSAQVNHSEKM